MKQYLTELRQPWRGSRWVGPVVAAPSMRRAQIMMRESPYKVVGELLGTDPDKPGEIDVYIMTGNDQQVH